MVEQSIAITGSGIVCAIGTDKEEVRQALIGRKSGIGEMKHLPSAHRELLVGEVKLSDEELKAHLYVPAEEIVSRTTLLGAYALRQAMDDAGLDAEALKGKRVCFLSGTTVGGMDVTERLYPFLLTDDASLHYLDEHDCGSCSHRIARIAGLQAEVCTLSTACSSALNAIILGARMLLEGETDLVIAGGAEALSLFHLNGFHSLMILDKEPCKPFDKDRAGLNLGEGAAYVVLERAEACGMQKAWAYIAGYGNRCDAFHQTATSENGEGAYLAMCDALSMAGKGSVDYVHAHGTGTPDNDRSESAALRRIFPGRMPPVSSTKSYTGHTTSASGAIETVICLLAMRHRFIPANIHWQKADGQCICPYMGQESVELNHVLCNSFGFGGNDSSLLLSRQVSRLPAVHCQAKIDELARYELHDTDELSALKQFVSPMELRRMDLLTKAALFSSLKALSLAGISTPDAIIVATADGMLSNSERILQGIITAGEDSVSPTLFMQSTHNTLAGMLAIRLKCHGYNTTYVQGADSMRWAMADARRLIAEGKANTVLVGCFDECTEQYASFLQRMGKPARPRVEAKSLLISRRKE